jgi:hypothetical protein
MLFINEDSKLKKKARVIRGNNLIYTSNEWYNKAKGKGLQEAKKKSKARTKGCR